MIVFLDNSNHMYIEEFLSVVMRRIKYAAKTTED